VREFSPGTPAPSDGTYEQCNVLGSVTGSRVTLAGGQKLPASPRGFTWRVVEPSPQTGTDRGESGGTARTAKAH
jgi:hypothetical protein